ncbi:hypothetical protein BKA62DRAFT_735474 [Auriculariales sp. MPI-PUGE-AT-0066]|nr:hypothetical protein BKA62DRAFT_735474 [Auriculariales sp. MPI-PUGE-AT-0066]
MVQCTINQPGNSSLVEQAASFVDNVLGLDVPQSSISTLASIVSNKHTLVGLYCAADWPGTCKGLCENADLAGPGVRVSFYAQSFFNGTDAPAACWGAALLTMAVIIPAFMQKKAGEITLHHALVVLNFATMSTIAAFASAPLCTFWRAADLPAVLEVRHSTADIHPLPPSPEQKKNLTSAVVVDITPDPPALLTTAEGKNVQLEPLRNTSGSPYSTMTSCRYLPRIVTSDLPDEKSTPGHPELPTPTAPPTTPIDFLEDRDFRKLKWSSRNFRSRVMLSVALLTQISLQWAWATFLFVDPVYSQTACNPSTIVVFFGSSRTALPRLPAWLLFCMLATLFWGIALVFVSDHQFPLVAPSEDTTAPSATKLGTVTSILRRMWNWGRRVAAIEQSEKRWILAGNVAAAIVWLFFLANNEIQMAANCVYDENKHWGFGQISAILLAAAPLWPLANALHRSWTEHHQGKPMAPMFATSPEQHATLHRPPYESPTTMSPRGTPGTLVGGSSLPASPKSRPVDIEREAESPRASSTRHRRGSNDGSGSGLMLSIGPSSSQVSIASSRSHYPAAQPPAIIVSPPEDSMRAIANHQSIYLSVTPSGVRNVL